jgi:general L-amino acid transport system permease protein
LTRDGAPAAAPASASWRERLIWQALVVGLLALGVLGAVAAVSDNLSRRGIRTGFGFLGSEAGFAIGETVPLPLVDHHAVYALAALAAGCVLAFLVNRLWRASRLAGPALIVGLPLAAYYLSGGRIATTVFSPESSAALALATGLGNTVKVAVAGCILATAFGLLIALCRLSTNWLVSSLARIYVELFRNVPLIIQVFFWYFGILRALPAVRQSVDVGGLVFLNNRGVFLPAPRLEDGFAAVCLAVLAGMAIGAGLRRRVRSWVALIALPAAAAALGFAYGGAPLSWEIPRLQGFNFRGGLALTPEFSALLLALTLYTAAFIAEVVRSGLSAVNRGQWEAGLALGLRPGAILRMIVIPQAIRIIVPPLISQYLSLIKDSSLGIAVAYPEIVSVAGTMINQTGQAIELTAITIAIYMVLNLATSALLNWYHGRARWVR